MDYTHYWTPISNERGWKRLIEDARKILSTPEADRVVCAEYDAHDRPAIIEPGQIRFNGAAEEGHETFMLRNDGEWAFCKTAQKPYDLFVVAILAVAEDLGCAEVSSDGDEGEWENGCAFASDVLGRIIPIPSKVRD